MLENGLLTKETVMVIFFLQMVLSTEVTLKMVSLMASVNLFGLKWFQTLNSATKQATLMLVSGKQEKCKVKDSFTMQMGILSHLTFVTACSICKDDYMLAHLSANKSTKLSCSAFKKEKRMKLKQKKKKVSKLISIEFKPYKVLTEL